MTASPLKMGPIGSLETSVLNAPTLRNNPEDGKNLQTDVLLVYMYILSHVRTDCELLGAFEVLCLSYVSV